MYFTSCTSIVVNKAKYFSLFFLFLFIFSSCASSSKLILTRKLPNYTNKPKNISVYLLSPPIRSFPIAVLSIVRYGSDPAWTVEALKEEAAELGADAIANLEIFYSTNFFLPRVHARGLAVKYGKL